VADKPKFTFAEKTVTIDGVGYKIRELSVGENDFCADAARKPDGDIDGRVMMRLMIQKSVVEPPIELEDLAAMPNRVYLRFAEAVNDINTPDLDEEDAKND
jgi:hypothetical protein